MFLSWPCYIALNDRSGIWSLEIGFQRFREFPRFPILMRVRELEYSFTLHLTLFHPAHSAIVTVHQSTTIPPSCIQHCIVHHMVPYTSKTTISALSVTLTYCKVQCDARSTNVLKAHNHRPKNYSKFEHLCG